MRLWGQTQPFGGLVGVSGVSCVFPSQLVGSFNQTPALVLLVFTDRNMISAVCLSLPAFQDAFCKYGRIGVWSFDLSLGHMVCQ